MPGQPSFVPRRRSAGRALAGLTARVDPGLAGLREAAVTMAATLASFASGLVIEHVAHLSVSIAILAVALALSIGRAGTRAGHRSPRGIAIAALVLPLVAVAANEIGTRIFEHPNLGDALFVMAMSATVWVRRFGPTARQVATFATLPLVAMLVVPVPVIAGNGSASDGRWWSALAALMALGWVTAIRAAAGRAGILAPVAAPPAPAGDKASAPRAGRRMAASTKMALQMAAALGGAFAAGRGLFGTHWTWAVLTAFIVCSGNRGRADVVYKAALRLAGAAAGTLAATAIAGAFPPGDRWSIVAIFAVLTVALWLRQANYAYWAAGVTAALALLYGYYGEGGAGLLGNRLAAILVGAALAVAVSWLVFPVRTTDIIRRDVAAALVALDGYLAALSGDPASVTVSQDRFRQAADLRAGIGDLRQANARRLPPDPVAWQRLAEGVRGLSRPGDPPPAAAPARDRFWTSAQKVIAYANRVHATTYQLVSGLPEDGLSLAYLVEDVSGGQARLTWSRDASLQRITPDHPDTEIAAGRTPSGYPYRLARTGPESHPVTAGGAAGRADQMTDAT